MVNHPNRSKRKQLEAAGFILDIDGGASDLLTPLKNLVTAIEVLGAVLRGEDVPNAENAGAGVDAALDQARVAIANALVDELNAADDADAAAQAARYEEAALARAERGE